MSNAIMRIPTPVSRFLAAAVVALTAVVAGPAPTSAQEPPHTLLKLEVADSLGLPLPDARLEVFTLMQGGIFWEWVSVSPDQLPAGINLLRFSHPGYRASAFSVPMHKGSQVSLRVRLDPERDTTQRRGAIEVRELRATGLAIEGRMKSDVVGQRRILERSAVEQEPTGRFGSLLNRARATELNIVPTSGGSYRPLPETLSGRRQCVPMVMLNGDRRHILTFTQFDELYSTGDAEVIEVFPPRVTVPTAYQVRRFGCGMLVVWFKTP